MARIETDREDLMREATALRRRVELRVPGDVEPVVAGFRTDDSLSVYFGQESAYHFDPAGRLRRAFVEGWLFRTQGDTLARLTRVRTPQATELRRHDLTPAERREFLETMRRRISRLGRHVAEGTVEMLRRVPSDDDLLPHLGTAVERILQAEQPLAPRLRGKP